MVERTQTPCSVAWFDGEDKDPMLLGKETDTSLPGSGLFVSASHKTEPDTRSMTRRSVYNGGEEKGGRLRTKTRTLLDHADNRLTQRNVIQISRAEHGLERESRHGCLITAKTGPRGPSLFRFVFLMAYEPFQVI